jgi:hypothetical protein
MSILSKLSFLSILSCQITPVYGKEFKALIVRGMGTLSSGLVPWSTCA